MTDDEMILQAIRERAEDRSWDQLGDTWADVDTLIAALDEARGEVERVEAKSVKDRVFLVGEAGTQRERAEKAEVERNVAVAGLRSMLTLYGGECADCDAMGDDPLKHSDKCRVRIALDAVTGEEASDG